MIDSSGHLDAVATPSAAPASCGACAHGWSSHDALGVRFCTATMASARPRGCICVPDAASAGVTSR